MLKIIIDKYDIRTGMGTIQDSSGLTFLTEDEIRNLNTIGYSGKLNGLRTSRQTYLNSLDKGTFLVDQTKFDDGTFVEEFTITRSYLNALEDVVVKPISYEIKISGNGTPQEIKKSLLDIIGGIDEAIEGGTLNECYIRWC